MDGEQRTERGRRRGIEIGPALRRACFLSVVWWVLVGEDGSGWLFGAVAIPAAAAASLLLGPTARMRLRPLPLARFVGTFLIQSLLSAIDVARRAFHPRLPLSPGFVDYPLRLESETSRVLLAATITMLPGTVTTEIREDRLVVHSIDTARSITSKVWRMETLIGDLFVGEPAGGPLVTEATP